MPGSNTLLITFAASADQIFVENTLGGSRIDQIEQIRFDDGTTLSIADVLDRILQDATTESDDVILGSPQVDTLAGGAGSDVLSGGDGADTYIFARGDGEDIIDDNGFNER